MANYTPNQAIIGGSFQDFEGNALNLGYLVMELSHDEETATPAFPSPSQLGSAANFEILANSTITNTGATVVSGGNLGLYPGTSVTGFPPGIVTFPWMQHIADSVAHQAQTDLTAAITFFQAMANTGLASADLAGQTYTAGVYRNASSVQISAGSVTLDAQNNPNATFVFQIGSTLTLASGTSVLLVNGAQAGNVYWIVGSSATLGTTSTLLGNILAVTSITLNTGVTLTGRALASGGAVTISGASTISAGTTTSTSNYQIVGGLKLRIPLDASGNINPPVNVWSNNVLVPAGSFYTVRAFKADGTEASKSPQYWIIPSTPDPFNVGTIIPLNPPGPGIAGSGSPLTIQVNAVNAGSQTLLNLQQGTNVTLVDNGLGQVTISATGGANFTTASQGWFLGGQSFAPLQDGSGTAIYSSKPANTVIAVQLLLTASYTIRKMAAYCITGSSVQGFAAGLYSIDGNTKLIDSGPITIPSASQKYLPVTLGSPVTLSPGIYWFAYGATTNSGQPSMLSHFVQTFFTSMINGIDFSNSQVLPTRYGTCANSLSAGNLPATLGAITPLDNSSGQNIPAVMFIV